MQVPLEIRFHQVDPSPSLEHEIRERVAKLDRLYDRLTACRVSIEYPHRQHQTGNIWEVHIEMSVPGRRLVVSREPHKAKQKFADPNVRAVLRVAFKAAERQLIEFREQQRSSERIDGMRSQGSVSRIEGDHGFILTNQGTELRFERSALADGAFEQLNVGDNVFYMTAEIEGGPKAVAISSASA